MAAGTQLDYTLQAYSVAVAGTVFAGASKKTTLPKLKKKTEEHRGGGMLMPRKIALGYESMDWDGDFVATDPNLLNQCGLYLGNRNLTFSVRGYMDGDNNAQHTAIIQMTGEVTELDQGDWEPGKMATVKMKVALSALTYTIDGNLVWQLDAQNGVYNVGGTDMYAAVAAALGL